MRPLLCLGVGEGANNNAGVVCYLIWSTTDVFAHNLELSGL